MQWKQQQFDQGNIVNFLNKRMSVTAIEIAHGVISLMNVLEGIKKISDIAPGIKEISRSMTWVKVSASLGLAKNILFLWANGLKKHACSHSILRKEVRATNVLWYFVALNGNRALATFKLVQLQDTNVFENAVVFYVFSANQILKSVPCEKASHRQTNCENTLLFLLIMYVVIYFFLFRCSMQKDSF